MLVGKIERRLTYKQMYKETKEPKYNSLQEMGKLSLNGGALYNSIAHNKSDKLLGSQEVGNQQPI